MHDIDRINHLLHQVAAQHHIDFLRLNADGTVGLELGDGVFLYLEYVESRRKLFIYSPVLPVPEHESMQLAIFRLCLMMNDLELDTDGCTFAICSQHRKINLQASLDIMHIGYDELDAWINSFLDCRDNFALRLKEALHDSEMKLLAVAAAARKNPARRPEYTATKFYSKE